ncbi:hypothetical protein [Pinibacter aurantiacus]|uniref:Uncharacterized protein n=1 Tax=Pinibacter aurantiacus TaxID=2851599 RepID=A0A9E2S9F8_9BACT|nr:hypothetical protein [Pinibacter aurantiacus]MBV4357328.1 hypothetical protein [Pinibacter aurantiacus]
MKKYYLGAVALLTAITLNSFTIRTSHKGITKNFVYTAYPNDSQINNPAFYQMTGNDGQDPWTCSGTLHRCAVIAQDDGTGSPDLTQPYTVRTRN